MNPRSPDEFDDLDGESAAIVALLLPRADGKLGPARRLSPEASARIFVSAVDEVLAARADEAAPARAGARERRPPARIRPAPPPRRWARAAAIAAGVLLALGVGSGASAIALRLLEIELGSAELSPAPPPRAHRPAAPPPPAAPERAPEQPLQELEVELPAAAPTRAPARPPRRRKALHAAAAAPAPEPIVVVPEDRPPEDLLALANERRQRREWRAADVFYAAVVRRFPGTDAAVVAEVASAALRLQHLGDAPGALAAYRRALGARPSGPLAEDARWGIAEAQRALGDAPAEAQALREFLAWHPQSTLAPAARRRLSRLAP